MSNTPLPEPDSRWHPSWGLPSTYSADQMHAHAAAVSAAECEPLMAEIEALRQDGSRLAADNAALQTSLADSRAYVERLKSRIDEVVADNAALRKNVERLKTVPMKYRRMEFNAQLQNENAALRERIKVLEDALTHISLCSQNSASSKEECGRIARTALGDKT